MNATEIDNNNKKSKLFMKNKDSDMLRSYPNDPKYALPRLQYTAFDIFQSRFFFFFFLSGTLHKGSKFANFCDDSLQNLL